MINERVCNDMSLILHAVPLNQDTDTLSTWRVVSDADNEQKRTISISISILTKADLALKDGKDVLKKRLKKIFADSKSSEYFIVHGSASGSEEEENQLATVVSFIEERRLGDSVKVGIKELNNFIEDRMLDHTRERIPETRRLLEDELRLCTRELDKLRRDPICPIAIALRDSQRMKDELKDLHWTFQPEYRLFAEKMTDEIFSIDVRPLGLCDANRAKQILDKSMQDDVTIGESSREMMRIHVSRAIKITSGQYENHLLALEVKKIGEDSRAMINVPYVGKRREVERWLCTFADPLEKTMKKYIENVFELIIARFFNQPLKSDQVNRLLSLRSILSC